MSTTLCRPIFSTIVRSNITRILFRLGNTAAMAVAPAWLARTLATRFVTPPRPRPTPAELAALEPATRLSVATSRGELAVWQFGAPERPAVLFSHGWGGHGAQFHHFTAPLIAAGFQVWLFDHVGHGQSAGRDTPITDLATGIHAVLDAIVARGIPVHGLVGHSLGATGVVIALSGTRESGSLRIVNIAQPASPSGFSHQFARQMGLPESLRQAIQWRLESRIGKPWKTFELPAAVASLPQKALIIHDTDDRVVSFSNGLAIARSWPGARFLGTRQLGHRRILEAPSVIAATVDFLAANREFPPPPTSQLPNPSPLY